MQEYYSVNDIERANRNAGFHFFDTGAKRFFRSRIGENVYQGKGGIFFTTSEQFRDSCGKKFPRKYTVRRFDPETGNVSTVGEFNAIPCAGIARRLAEKLAKGLVS